MRQQIIEIEETVEKIVNRLSLIDEQIVELITKRQQVGRELIKVHVKLTAILAASEEKPNETTET